MTGQASFRVIAIPDCLNGDPRRVEQAISALYTDHWLPGTRPVLDLAAVSFVRPYGAVQLLGACVRLAGATGRMVELRNIRLPVHAYLRRVNFFTSVPNVVITHNPFNSADELSRSPASTNVLELHPIALPSDITAAVEAADRILKYWLSHSLKDRGRVIDLVSEACNNVVEHSDGTGWVVAQKYERQGVAVELAIADDGIGIPGSLERARGRVASADSEYITKAIKGLSSKRPQKSVGLPTMRTTTGTSGGYLFIRSSQGEVMARDGRFLPRVRSVVVPGTQLAMCFESSN